MHYKVIASREKEFMALFGSKTLDYNDNSARLLHLIIALQNSNAELFLAYVKSVSPRETSFLLNNPLDASEDIKYFTLNFHDPLIFKKQAQWFITSSLTDAEILPIDDSEKIRFLEDALKKPYLFETVNINGLDYYKFRTGDLFGFNVRTSALDFITEFKTVHNPAKLFSRANNLEHNLHLSKLNKSVIDRQHKLLLSYDTITKAWATKPLNNFVIDNKIIQSKWLFQHTTLVKNPFFRDYIANKITFYSIFGKLIK